MGLDADTTAGAGDPHGAARGAARALWLALAYAGIVSVLVLAFHDPVLRMFIAEDAAFSHEAFVSLGFTLFLLMTAWQLFTDGFHGPWPGVQPFPVAP